MRPPIPCSLLAIGALLAACVADAQPGAPDLGESVADARVAVFDHLSVADGLSVEASWAIEQDARGFVWIGTSQGLNRYDGHSIRVFKHRPGDPRSLADSDIYTLFLDSRGELWVGTAGGGLDRFIETEERFEHFRHDPQDPESLSFDYVNAIAEDPDGRLWVATERGLNRLDPATGRVQRFLHDARRANSLSDDGSEALLVDRDGVLWVGTEGGLDRFDAATEGFEHFRHRAGDESSLGHPKVTALEQAEDGRLWVGTAGGLDRFDPRSGVFERFRHSADDLWSLTDGRVFDLHIDRRGRLWVGTLGGLCRFDEAARSFRRFPHDPADARSLSADSVLAIEEDLTGVLWFGTFAGVNRYVPAREAFALYRPRAGRPGALPIRGVTAVLEDRAGELWVGGEGGLARLDAARRTEAYYVASGGGDGLPEGRVTSLLEDRDGALWLGTWVSGLLRLERSADGDRFTSFAHDPDDTRSLSNNSVVTVYEDAEGRLWVGTMGGLDLLEGTGRERLDGRFTRLMASSPTLAALGWEEFTAVLQDSSGTIWAGANPSGLYRLDPGLEPRADLFERHAPDPHSAGGLASGKVLCLLEGRDGTLWIGTLEGLARLPPEERHLGRYRFRHYRQSDGLPNDAIAGMLEDDRGLLWLATYDGLARFDPRSGEVVRFGVEDGLQGNAFWYRAAARGRHGELYFGGADGLSAFSPTSVQRDTQPPRVTLTAFSLFNKEVHAFGDESSPLELPIGLTPRLVLDHRQLVFGFEFAALHFAKPRRHRFAYRLEGFDSEWVETGSERRFADYSNLAPGRYRLRVRASNGDGVWSDETREARLDLLVRPAPWMTVWAWSFYAVTLFGLVTWAVAGQRRKIRREREVNARLRQVDRLKDEFLANTSHELRTPLFGITGLAESLIDGAKGELPDAARGDLDMIVASGRRLAALVDDLLDFSKLEQKSLELELQPVDLRSSVDVVLTLSAPLVLDRAVALVNAVDADLPAAMADERRLQQVLHNLVGNAIKFTAEGSVEVSARIDAESRQIVLAVRDTGSGVETADRERIFRPFEQGAGGSDRGGTGLGLAVSRQLVELQGGRLWLESSDSRGSTFCFSVPAAAHAATPRRPAAVAAREPVAPATDLVQTASDSDTDGDVRILIVDDEPVNRQVLANHLISGGYRCALAADGAEALELIEEEHFDLVLLDVMMPKMSGYEVCRILRRHHSLDELPVLFLTARSRLPDRIGGLAAGANDYLTKPVAKDELLARVRTHLELLRSHRQQLGKLLPICAECHKVRDDEGYWDQIETYLSDHAGLVFSHGLCPHCAAAFQAEIDAVESKVE